MKLNPNSISDEEYRFAWDVLKGRSDIDENEILPQLDIVIKHRRELRKYCGFIYSAGAEDDK
jgi:hypothetical protein